MHLGFFVGAVLAFWRCVRRLVEAQGRRLRLSFPLGHRNLCLCRLCQLGGQRSVRTPSDPGSGHSSGPANRYKGASAQSGWLGEAPGPIGRSRTRLDLGYGRGRKVGGFGALGGSIHPRPRRRSPTSGFSRALGISVLHATSGIPARRHPDIRTSCRECDRLSQKLRRCPTDPAAYGGFAIFIRFRYRPGRDDHRRSFRSRFLCRRFRSPAVQLRARPFRTLRSYSVEASARISRRAYEIGQAGLLGEPFSRGQRLCLMGRGSARHGVLDDWRSIVYWPAVGL
jgi:hypothetical protein